MPLFFDLPTDLALAILIDWLADTKSVVSLDSASARSTRWAYLDLVRDSAFVLTEAVSFGEDIAVLCAIRYWIGTRVVKVQAIKATATALKQTALISFECLAAVNSLTLICGPEEHIDLESFRVLLKLLPSLTSLDMGHFHASTVDHLVVLSAMHHLRLRSLMLDNNCPESGHIGLLVYPFGSTLEVLHLGEVRCVEAATLHLLESKCNNLKDLSFTCDELLSEVLASAFGAGKFPLLEKIALSNYGDDAVINDEIVLTLCANHPNLEDITVKNGSSITLSSVAVALSHCPRFRVMITVRFEFSIVFTTADSDESRNLAELPHYKLLMHGQAMEMPDFRAAFEAIKRAPFFKHKVRNFQRLSGSLFSNNEVEEIIGVLGKDLHMLHIDLGGDVTHQTMERLYRDCSALRTLYLEHCVALTDELVILLADQCHNVRFLSLGGAVNITNLCICYLLQRMGQRLLSLYIDQCPQLTQSSLVAIVEYCASLEVLDITGTGISADAIISHMIKPDRLLKLTELTVDPAILESLEEFVENKENGANERWDNLLERN